MALQTDKGLNIIIEILVAACIFKLLLYVSFQTFFFKMLFKFCYVSFFSVKLVLLTKIRPKTTKHVKNYAILTPF